VNRKPEFKPQYHYHHHHKKKKAVSIKIYTQETTKHSSVMATGVHGTKHTQP
jgi:hypothetical protein